MPIKKSLLQKGKYKMFFKKKKEEDALGRLMVMGLLRKSLEVIYIRFKEDSERVDALEKRIAILESAKPAVKRGRKPRKKGIRRGKKCAQGKK